MVARGIWLFILWQVFWLNIVIPGHTRGAITVPGGKDECCVKAQGTASCCSLFGKSAKGKQPTEDQQRRCAICYLAAGYTVPPVYTFDLDISGRAVERLEAVTAQVITIDFAFPFYPNGPPGLS